MLVNVIEHVYFNSDSDVVWKESGDKLRLRNEPK